MNSKNLKPRSPVVVVLGHVDHGKTSILDYIRKSQIADKESGGITQHIGAYQVQTPKGEIAFIDTPGHEAFSAMRSRGSKVADVAVLVVAAEEGVKPQTKEAIAHIKKSELPYVVAINKIDKEGALPEKVKKELSENEVFVESYGGDVPSVNVSAKTGQGIDELLEMILLLAELAELKYDPTKKASGVVIESNMDAGKGATATLLVKEGILKIKDPIACESCFGAIKSMVDWQNNNLKEAPASTPVKVLGLNEVPFVGETWEIKDSLDKAKKSAGAKKIIEQQKRRHQEFINPEENQKILNIILKADTIGTLEAVRQSLEAINQEKVVLRILEESVGNVNENDVKLAISAKARIFCFKAKISGKLSAIAEREKVKIKSFDIIYELIQAVRESMSALLDPIINKKSLGKMEVLAIFKNSAEKRIIGGKVQDGLIQRGAKVDILRNGDYIGSGQITQLQHNKQDTPDVSKGKECGLLVKSQEEIYAGDILEDYEEEKKKQSI